MEGEWHGGSIRVAMDRKPLSSRPRVMRLQGLSHSLRPFPWAPCSDFQATGLKNPPSLLHRLER